MAYADVREYTHLTDEEVEAIGAELDAMRAEIEESRGQADRDYILRIIALQRRLADRRAHTCSPASSRRPGCGMLMLGSAKILENIEIGHNTMHGQWDWMNDPEIHSSNWEWDTTQPAEQWKHSHNYIHHQFTNVIGHDNDVGYGILRMSRDQKWHPIYLGQPTAMCRWPCSSSGVGPGRSRHRGHPQAGEAPEGPARALRQIRDKVGKQVLKDYLVYPALTCPFFLRTLTVNVTAN